MNSNISPRIHLRLHGTVKAIVRERPGLQNLLVTDTGTATDRSAICYSRLTGRAEPGNAVELNTCAQQLGLGTGGSDFVLWVDRVTPPSEVPGHILKLRYTPMQLPVLAAEAPESEWHQAIRDFENLQALPIVCAELHSQLAPIVGAVNWETGGAARIAYVMTDSAALIVDLSDTVADLKARGLLHCTVTCGQAVGGDFEAVNLFSALAVAAVAGRADVIVVCQGPGQTGTATPLGFSGADQAIALYAATVLGGNPIAVVRLSEADPRDRHQGISHHSITVLEQLGPPGVYVPLPRLQSRNTAAYLDELSERVAERQAVLTVDVDEAWAALLGMDLPMHSMGRDAAVDEVFFQAAVAAGLVAGQIANIQRDQYESG